MNILLFTILLSINSGFDQEGALQARSQQVRARFLAEDFGKKDVLVLAEYPHLLTERPIQRKLYRAFRHEKIEVSSAVLSLCFHVKNLWKIAPMLQRRCDSSFIGRRIQPKESFLTLLLQDQLLLRDLRMVGLVNRALHSEKTSLRELGERVLDRFPRVRNMPSIAEALPGNGRKLPTFKDFAEKVNPILTQPGPDGRACVDCHARRPILFLPSLREGGINEPVLRQRYRSVLNVIDLAEPEASMILRKPLNPAPDPPQGTSEPGLHSGGVRFTKGSVVYEILLAWIRSGELD
jgi:hypothetical protein